MDGYVVFDHVMSESDRARVLQLIADRPAQTAGLDARPADEDYRTGDVRWLNRLPDRSWLFDRVDALADVANDRYGFDVTGVEEPVQITTYSPGPVGFDWHTDIGTTTVTNRRKLTLVIEVGEADTGAGVDLMRSRDVDELRLRPGQAVVFPSFTLHRAVPPTHRTRTSLVAWLSGPPLR